MKKFYCQQVVPDCAFIASASTEEEVLKQVKAHAAKEHGITDISPELAAKVKSAIKTDERGA
jgi:predicted small metal-binding protein